MLNLLDIIFFVTFFRIVAVSVWQLAGSVGIVLIAFTLLPKFLSAGIYTMPEYLEVRYNATARLIMAIITLAIYVLVLLTAILYSGGIAMATVFGMDLTLSIWVSGGAALLYTAWGGLRAVAWADTVLELILLLGGMLVFFWGMSACGGWQNFQELNAEKLHMVLPADHPQLPWTGVVSGMGIAILYYCGLNQYIIQRSFAAKSLRHGQMGLVFAGAIWLSVPFLIVIPGIMAHQLYPHQLMDNYDRAFPILIGNLIPPGLRGLMLASIAAAVVSSVASLLMASATIFSLDIYRRFFHASAFQALPLAAIAGLFSGIGIYGGCHFFLRSDNGDPGCDIFYDLVLVI